MEIVKKSFNLTGDLAQRLDDFIKQNPGISFTWLVNQALLNFLQNPQVTLRTPKPMTEDDLKQFMDKNKDLMDDLAK